MVHTPGQIDAAVKGDTANKNGGKAPGTDVRSDLR